MKINAQNNSQKLKTGKCLDVTINISKKILQMGLTWQSAFVPSLKGVVFNIEA